MLLTASLALADEKLAIETYSQKTLLKNWALSTCLALIAKSSEDKDDASISASAYLEFGHQDIEAYDALQNLATQYSKKKYGGSIPGEFNTAKCIDLYNSAELDRLATKWSKARR